MLNELWKETCDSKWELSFKFHCPPLCSFYLKTKCVKFWFYETNVLFVYLSADIFHVALANRFLDIVM